MENLDNNELHRFIVDFDIGDTKKVKISIDVNEIQKKYESGKQLTKDEKLCLLLVAKNQDEINELIKGDKDLEKIYYETFRRIDDNVIRFIETLRVEVSYMHNQIFESEYMLSTDRLYDLAYKIGYNDCLIHTTENLEASGYSKEDIEKIIDEEIPELDPEYREKYKDDEKEKED